MTTVGGNPDHPADPREEAEAEPSAQILAIDDSDQNLAMIQLYLDGAEFDVSTARSGRDALDLVQRQEFDLILLDVVMPKMGGFDVCRRLKADPRTAHIPVIFLTARMRDEQNKLQAFEVGGVDYINKPVNKDELIARIRVMLRLRSARTVLKRENLALAQRVAELSRAHDRLVEELDDHRALERERRSAPRAGLLLDPAGRVVGADERARAMFGEDVVSVPLADLDQPLAAELERFLAGESDRDRLTSEPGRTYAVERRHFDDRHSVVEVVETTDVRDAERRLEARELASPPPPPSDRGYRITGLVGESVGLRELARQVDVLRNVRSTVLICGESGTGKEPVARALHYDGKYQNAPFIPIHCGAISPELIESELFGYDRGAFTGATTSKQGLFTAADGGTVFLDEIAETSQDLQVKLLRVLQLGEIRPVGATHAQHVDVRIIAATNQELRAKVEDGTFRQDLFYRLDVITLYLPPLRERVGDIEELVEHFIAMFSLRHEREVKGVSQGALEVLRAYPWPGNVRELENAINAAFALGCGDVIQESDLPPHVREGYAPVADPIVPDTDRSDLRIVVPRPGEVPLRAQRARLDKAAIVRALANADGDKSLAARALGMSRSTFYRKLKEFGVS